MRRWLLVAILFVVAWPVAAQAKCKMPSAFFSVPGDQRVPTKPVLHLFTPPRRAVGKPPPLIVEAIDARGRKLPVKTLESTRTPAFEAFTVTATVTTPGEVTFRARAGDDRRFEATATVTVVTDFDPPPTEPVTIRHTETEAFFWTCSSQHSQNLTPSVVAPAYRVVWAPSRSDFDAGKRRSFIAPAAMTGFFGIDRKSKAIVELGASNCIGRTFDFEGRSVWVALQALHADGTTTSLGPPRRVSPPG